MRFMSVAWAPLKVAGLEPSCWNLLFPIPPPAKKAAHQIRSPRSERIWIGPLVGGTQGWGSVVNLRWISLTQVLEEKVPPRNQ